MTELIHLKLERTEALLSKKEILLSEKSLVEIMKTIRNYQELRKQELLLKIKLQKKLTEAHALLKKLQNSFPKQKIIDLPTKKDYEMNFLEEKLKQAKEKKYHKDLEDELKEIQDKLRNIGYQ
jgi:uncharacterized protein HemY